MAGAATLLEELREMTHPAKQTEVAEDLAEHLARLWGELEHFRAPGISLRRIGNGSGPK